jgi:hypothetical protein
LPFHIQEASKTPNRIDQNKTSPQHIIIKTTNTENRGKILKAIKEKKQIIYKVKPVKIIADFTTETLKARRSWSETFQALNENNFFPRILPFKIDRAIKIFHNIQKLKEYVITKPHYRRFCKEFCSKKIETNRTMRGQEVLNHRRRKDKQLQSSIDYTAHKQILKQQKQLNGRNHHILINISTTYKWTQLPHQKMSVGILD